MELTPDTLPHDPEATTREVYFLYCSGFVKIGVTNHLTRRMKELQVATPWRSQVICTIPGGRGTEDYFHFIFQSYHFRGEWFSFGPDLRSFIERKAPDYALEWLAEEEQIYLDLIEQQARLLGLITEERKVIPIRPGGRNGNGWNVRVVRTR